ncbi:MAG: cation-translocating P-type ATPase [Eubacteriales bacterium]|nr:cation-translocating P-type ATPase [Eubacteriales bacterium]
MIKKINDVLADLPATIVAGICLLLKLLLQYGFKMSIPIYLDPAWIAVVITGIPLLYLAIWRVIHNPGISKISSALLICIGMTACIAMTFMMGHDELFAAGEIGFIMSIGAILEDKTTEHARSGLKKLMSLKPEIGRLLVDGKETMVAVEKIAVGDILRVKPGEIIPVDGIIQKGSTSVDQSIMTGESLPLDKEVGDEVYCGTLNYYGSVDLLATKVGQESSLQKLIKLVEGADNQKAPIARIADQAASWLVPVALLIAILAFVFTGNVEKAVTILVVFCPCALILATPTAVMAGIGHATKHGVIIKSGEALEKMGKVNTIAFDKTGTLTYGTLKVSDIICFDENMKSQKLLVMAATAEIRSEHPLGKAIVKEAEAENLTIFEADEFHMTSGKGVQSKIQGKKVLCGNEKFLEEEGYSLDEEMQKILSRLRQEGKASILVSMEEKIIGVIALSDVLRENSRETIEKLEKMGVKTILLTGDHSQTAHYFADKTGIREIRAELLPEDKMTNIQKMQEEGDHVCMIGDGVNDAPALKLASIGVAMGSMGTDIAVEAADIALMSDDISRIPYLKKLSDLTVKTIKTSITLSLIINAFAITFSLMGVLNPTTGALWHNVGSCLVVLLAASLYDRKIEV